jgi:hypothetical protein
MRRVVVKRVSFLIQTGDLGFRLVRADLDDECAEPPRRC